MQYSKNLIDVSLLVLVASGVFLIFLIITGTPEVIARLFRFFRITNMPRTTHYANPQE